MVSWWEHTQPHSDGEGDQEPGKDYRQEQAAAATRAVKLADNTAPLGSQEGTLGVILAVAIPSQVFCSQN